MGLPTMASAGWLCVVILALACHQGQGALPDLMNSELRDEINKALQHQMTQPGWPTYKVTIKNDPPILKVNYNLDVDADFPRKQDTYTPRATSLSLYRLTA